MAQIRSWPMSRRTLIKGAAAAGLGAPFLAGCGAEDNRLSLAIWPDYLGETTLDDFRRATGIEVTITTITGMEDLYARLKAGNHGFDLVVPSSPWVERLVREELLSPLSRTRLSQLGNLEPAFTNMPYDPGNLHSVPYTWMALGIGYRRSKAATLPAGWKALLAGPGNAGRIALPADPALLFRIAAKAAGFSANLFNPERLTQAEALLKQAMPRIKALHRDGGQDLLLRREVDLIAGWNADIAQVALEDPDIAFAIPAEGALLQCDCLAVPKDAARPANAHAFIDFALSAQGGAGIAGTLWFPSPNQAARELLDPAYRSNPVLFPPPVQGARSEFISDNPGLDAQFAAALQRIQVPQ